jgi:hypothetical protein
MLGGQPSRKSLPLRAGPYGRDCRQGIRYFDGLLESIEVIEEIVVRSWSPLPTATAMAGALVAVTSPSADAGSAAEARIGLAAGGVSVRRTALLAALAPRVSASASLLPNSRVDTLGLAGRVTAGGVSVRRTALLAAVAPLAAGGDNRSPRSRAGAS